jgi:hypothetical protein
MKLAVGLFLLLLCACEQQSPHERTVRLVLSEDIRADCGESFLEPYGCAKVNGAHCTIVAKRPKSFDDQQALKTLGHELWHCFVGPTHI